MATAEEQAERPSLRAEPKSSLKEQFRNLPRGKPVPVDMRRFPHAPQDVYMKPPAGAKIAKWEQSGIEYGRKGRAKIKTSPTRKAELVVMCACDGAGDLIWSDDIPANKTVAPDVRDVANFDADIVNHMFAAARKVAGQDVGDDDDEDDEDEEGN